jgi:hypothetical protein
MTKRQKPVTRTPNFMTENEEAKWWVSAKGREFLKRRSSAKAANKQNGSPLVANLNRASSVQIALRLPAPDLAKAREIAGKQGNRLSDTLEDAGP